MYMEPYGNYEYDYGSAMSELTGFAGAMIGVVLVCYLLVAGFAVASYVLQSLGFYKIAKRRGIHNPWLAWLPVGNVWILGSISDQYQYVAKGKLCNRRKVLMGLNIAMIALAIPVVIGYATVIAGIITGFAASGVAAGAGAMITALGYFAMVVLGIINMVFVYIALYDLYNSCSPDNSVLFIIFSVLIQATMPFFVFACRMKDKGMPPRKPQPVVEMAEEMPAEEVPVEEVSAEEEIPQ